MKHLGKNHTGIIIGAAAILAVAILLATLELTGTIHFFHHGPYQTANQYTKGEPQGRSSGSGSQTSSPAPQQSSAPSDGLKSVAGGSSNAPLLAPFGNFVSAHHVSLSTPINSVCNTTPGAVCSMSFTMNGTVKSLRAATTDQGGAAYWNGWTPNSIGLTAGTWKIQATATLGKQTKTSSDAMDLVIAS
jgi:hypothetical protein